VPAYAVILEGVSAGPADEPRAVLLQQGKLLGRLHRFLLILQHLLPQILKQLLGVGEALGGTFEVSLGDHLALLDGAVVVRDAL